MIKNKIYLFIIITHIFTSCVINGSLQGLYSYYKKTKADKPNLLLKPKESEICELKNTEIPKIYTINGKQLAMCLKSYNASIVYIWSPKCKSKFCYPLNVVQEKCNMNNIPLFVVAEYYDGKLMDINYKIEKPIFGIDTEYYNSNLTSKYFSDFMYDLIHNKEIENNFLFFSNGVLKKVFDDIKGIDALKIEIK